MAPAKETKAEKKAYNPHNGPSETMVKITVEVSEDVARVYEENGRDIAQQASDILTSTAQRLGWL